MTSAPAAGPRLPAIASLRHRSSDQSPFFAHRPPSFRSPALLLHGWTGRQLLFGALDCTAGLDDSCSSALSATAMDYYADSSAHHGPPPMSCSEIATRATDFDWEPLIPLRYWLRTANTLVKEVRDLTP